MLGFSISIEDYNEIIVYKGILKFQQIALTTDVTIV